MNFTRGLIKRSITVMTALAVVICSFVADAAHLLGMKRMETRSGYTTPDPLLMKIDWKDPNRVPGGIGYVQTASNVDGEVVIGLEYLPDQSDGSRLAVRLRTADGTESLAILPIFDWQLAPIARYCNSEFDGLVDLKVGMGGKLRVRYHPAIKQTFLGVMLFTADLLATDPASGDLPRNDVSGKVIRAGGLRIPRADQVSRSRNVISAVSTWKMLYYPDCAYTITDKNVAITFTRHGNVLQLSGSPQFELWRRVIVGGQETVEFEVQGTQEMNAFLEATDGFNPVVFGVVKSSCQLAALFRHAKQQMGPEAFSAFVKTLPTDEFLTPRETTDADFLLSADSPHSPNWNPDRLTTPE